LKIADQGPDAVPSVINVANGRVVHPAVADAVGAIA
jgi:hypothetical protein